MGAAVATFAGVLLVAFVGATLLMAVMFGGVLALGHLRKWLEKWC